MSTDHWSIRGGLNRTSHACRPAELLASCRGETHPDSCHQGGIIVTAVMPHAMDEEKKVGADIHAAADFHP